MALSFLEKRAFGAVRPEQPGSRLKALVLTAQGVRARDTYQRLVWSIEERWQTRFGELDIASLRQALECLQGGGLLRGLEPYPGNWRARVARPEVLPHYPMILHRGGFPDGS